MLLGFPSLCVSYIHVTVSKGAATLYYWRYVYCIHSFCLKKNYIYIFRVLVSFEIRLWAQVRNRYNNKTQIWNRYGNNGEAVYHLPGLFNLLFLLWWLNNRTDGRFAVRFQHMGAASQKQMLLPPSSSWVCFCQPVKGRWGFLVGELTNLFPCLWISPLEYK